MMPGKANPQTAFLILLLLMLVWQARAQNTTLPNPSLPQDTLPEIADTSTAPKTTIYYTDTTTYYTNTNCYIKVPPPEGTDTLLAAAYLTRLATIKCLLELSLPPLKKSNPTHIAPPPMLMLLPDFSLSDTVQIPPLWYNIKDLPQYQNAEIETRYFLQPLRLVSGQTTLLFYIFFAITVFYAFLSYNFPKYLSKLYEAVFNIYIARQFYEDFNHNIFIINILFVLINISTLGLFVYLAVTYFQKLQYIEDYVLMFIMIAAVGIYMLLRRTVLKLIAFILPLSELIYFYLFNLRMINIVSSIMLLPILLMMAFGGAAIEKIALYLAILLLTGTLTFIVYRGLAIVKEFVWQYKFHFFLYLCTLEIAPPLVLYKIASKYFL